MAKDAKVKIERLVTLGEDEESMARTFFGKKGLPSSIRSISEDIFDF